MPPIAPPKPPMPVTEPTAARGKISDDETKDIRGPALVCGAGQADDGNDSPKAVDVADHGYGKRAERTAQHGSAACGADAEAQAYPETGKPAAKNTAYAGGDVDGHDGSSKSIELQMEVGREVFWQPEEKEPPDQLSSVRSLPMRMAQH